MHFSAWMLATILLLPAAVGRAEASGRSTATTSLPDAPQAKGVVGDVGQTANQGGQTANQGLKPETQPNTKVGPRKGDPKALDPAQATVPLTAGDKIKLSFLQQATPFAFATEAIAAGWGHLRNTDPQYGTDSAGFGERMGAAALRQTSQSVFADGLFAAALHEDPRFYRMDGEDTGHRLLYAASRTWRTRTDSGSPTINFSVLAGYGAASALTMTYYPAVSATGSKTAAGYGYSLLGNMLGNQYHEFWPDVVAAIFHHPAKETGSGPGHPRWVN